MKKPFLTVALIPAVVLLVASGCNLVDSPSGTADLGKAGIVLKEEFCVTFDEYRTECDFTDDATEAIAAQIFLWLDENGIALGDVCQIFQSGGRITLAEPYVGHKWKITSRVDVKRLDIYDEYTTYLKTQSVEIPKKLEKKNGYKPKFYHRGVRKINRALEDMVDGQYPQLSFIMVSTDCDPEPTPSDPLVFSWNACIEVTVIVRSFNDDDDDNDGCPDYMSSKVAP